MASVTERVILAHGWLGLPYELKKLGEALQAAGFAVEYVRHYSLFGHFETAINIVLEKIEENEDQRVHLIGFSYGGLIMRAAAAEGYANIRSILLIGVPNAGSPFADWLSPIFPTPAVRQLRCKAPKLPALPQDVRVGCIAGNRPGVLGLLIKSPNDSRVTIESAFEIRHDYQAVVRSGHRTLPRNREVIRHAVAFLKGASNTGDAAGKAA